MFRVKICGITRVEDARAAADADADAIGLNFFNQSRRFVDPPAARAIADALPPGMLKVGVFVNHSAAQIQETIERVGLDAVQLHGDEPASLLAALPAEMPVIRAYRCGAAGLTPLTAYLDGCRKLRRLPQAVLIDADAGASFGGTGDLANWPTIVRDRFALGGLPLILAGGLTAENVADAVRAVQPDGVDVASGVENEAGRKDRQRVTRFVAAAREALAHRD